MASITVGTNSYVTVAEFQLYLDDRGIVVDTDLSTLLIKSMDSLENKRFYGEKTEAAQLLEFPRRFQKGTHCAFAYLSTSEVPAQIKKAQIVNALIINDGGNIEGETQGIKREKVASLEVEYADETGSSRVSYPSLDNLLFPFIRKTRVAKRI